MGYYERAAYELENDRRDDLWFYCLSQVEMDKRKAQALYIKKAIILLREEDKEIAFREKIRNAEEKSRRELLIESIKVERENIEEATKSFKIANRYFWAVVCAFLSFQFFFTPLVESAEGFFSNLWRWPIGIIHIFSSAIFAFVAVSYLRKYLVRYEELRFSEDYWVGAKVFGSIAFVYLLLCFVL